MRVAFIEFKEFLILKPRKSPYICSNSCGITEAEEVDIRIEEKDLRIDVFRSSGPGGQSVNTTDWLSELLIFQQELLWPTR